MAAKYRDVDVALNAVRPVPPAPPRPRAGRSKAKQVTVAQTAEILRHAFAILRELPVIDCLRLLRLIRF